MGNSTIKISLNSDKFFDIIFSQKDPCVILVIGGKGTGKTTSIKRVLKRYQKKFPKNSIKILSAFFDEYNDYKQPILAALCMNVTSERLKEIYEDEIARTNDSLVVIENMDMIYGNGKDSHEITGLLVTPRTRRNHYVITFQSIDKVPPKLLMNAGFIIKHKTAEKEPIKYNQFHLPSTRIRWFPILKEFHRVLYDIKNDTFRI